MPRRLDLPAKRGGSSWLMDVLMRKGKLYKTVQAGMDDSPTSAVYVYWTAPVSLAREDPSIRNHLELDHA